MTVQPKLLKGFLYTWTKIQTYYCGLQVPTQSVLYIFPQDQILLFPTCSICSSSLALVLIPYISQTLALTWGLCVRCFLCQFCWFQHRWGFFFFLALKFSFLQRETYHGHYRMRFLKADVCQEWFSISYLTNERGIRKLYLCFSEHV